MTMVVVSVELPHPVGAVWSELSQLDRHTSWMTDAERIEINTDGTHGVGTVMTVSTRVGPFNTADVIEVWDWSIGESIGVFHRGLVSGIGMFVLIPIESGTRFVWWEHLLFPWFLGGPIAAWSSRPILKWIWKTNLGRFARSFG